MRENALHSKALRVLRTEYPRGHWESSGTPFGSSGRADIRGTLACISVAIELKRPGIRDAYNAREEHQVWWAEKHIEAGGAYLCTSDDSCDEVRIFCDAVLEFAHMKGIAA